MAEPLVTREEAWQRLGWIDGLTVVSRHHFLDERRALRSLSALYDLDAAKDSCIDRLRNGWSESADRKHWVLTQPPWMTDVEPMTPAEIEVMSRG